MGIKKKKKLEECKQRFVSISGIAKRVCSQPEGASSDACQPSGPEQWSCMGSKGISGPKMAGWRDFFQQTWPVELTECFNSIE